MLSWFMHSFFVFLRKLAVLENRHQDIRQSKPQGLSSGSVLGADLVQSRLYSPSSFLVILSLSPSPISYGRAVAHAQEARRI